MIYKNAVEVIDPKNISTSSGELIDTSDKMLHISPYSMFAISESRRAVSPRPGTSRGSEREDRHRDPPEAPPPQQQADQLIQDANRNKARMNQITGMESLSINTPGLDRMTLLHSVVIDGGYLTVAAHVDDNLRRKILNFKYVDFVKLLPRDRINAEEDNRLTFVNKGGVPYLVPVGDSRESSGISSYAKWDQAFRVFCDIVSSKFPTKSTELIQYNHVIHTASQMYVWENVYNYDKGFRIHIAQNPFRTWSVILQQAWCMRLRDKIRLDSGSSSVVSRSPNGKHKKDLCLCFQRGACQFGLSCKFDHRCPICNKFGHGVHICRKRTGGHDRGCHERDRGDRNHCDGKDYRDGDRNHYFGDRRSSQGGGVSMPKDKKN